MATSGLLRPFAMRNHENPSVAASAGIGEASRMVAGQGVLTVGVRGPDAVML